ncbi:MAG: hypothetical protein DSY42_00480 [Aquifex sp.]|nr:MAG: hypothetical protein DSY42_00480 [Aquifex sp.]
MEKVVAGGAAFILVGYIIQNIVRSWFKNQFSRIERLEIGLSQLKETLPKEYVLKDDYYREIGEIKEEIHKMREEIKEGFRRLRKSLKGKQTKNEERTCS